MSEQRAFISYASEDLEQAERLYDELRLAPGLSPWLDRVDLVGGSRWDAEIRHAIRGAAVFILLLSESSTTKRGFIQKECRAALEVLEELPEGSAFLLPLRLEECEAHFEPFTKIQYIDMFPDWERGIANLRRALLVHLGIPETKQVDRSPGPRSRPANAASTLRRTATLPIDATSAVGRQDGVLIADTRGQLMEVDGAANVRRRRSILSNGDRVNCLYVTRECRLVLGTSLGRVLKLASWDADVVQIASCDGQIRGLHQDNEGDLLVTTGDDEILRIGTSGKRTIIKCGLPAFAMANGRTADETVVAVAKPGEGGLMHLRKDGLRYESIAEIQARALARSPALPLYAVGACVNGLNLLDYEVIPPGDGARATGWYLESEAVTIFEPRVGEAFDHLQHAAQCLYASFSADGRLIVGGLSGGQVVVWSVETGVELANACTEGQIVGLAFVNHANVAVATTEDVRFFSLPDGGAVK